MAMALANISRDTVDPEGGTVVKNIHGGIPCTQKTPLMGFLFMG
jgi:hypothetical protein